MHCCICLPTRKLKKDTREFLYIKGGKQRGNKTRKREEGLPL